jgi:hypothetical protein
MRVNRIARISIISGVLDDALPLNIEAWRALFQAKTIFHAGCSGDVASWLADFAKTINVVDLGLDSSRIGPHQPNLHLATAARVVVAAQMQGEVVLIKPAPTRVTNLVASFVEQIAGAANIPVRIIPAASIPTHAVSSARPNPQNISK